MSGDEHEKRDIDEKVAVGEDDGPRAPDPESFPDPETWPDDSSDPQITLDRYLSKRHPAPRMGWSQIFSMVVMLVGLILIMVYKDSCGRQVSQLMGAMNTADAGLPGVPVRVHLAPKTKPVPPKPQDRTP